VLLPCGETLEGLQPLPVGRALPAQLGEQLVTLLGRHQRAELSNLPHGFHELVEWGALVDQPRGPSLEALGEPHAIGDTGDHHDLSTELLERADQWKAGPNLTAQLQVEKDNSWPQVLGDFQDLIGRLRLHGLGVDAFCTQGVDQALGEQLVVFDDEDGGLHRQGSQFINVGDAVREISVFPIGVLTRLGGRRVVIVVEPRLLSETLARALQRPDVEVSIGLEPPVAGEERFDVAVVMGDVPPGVNADVVVRVPEGDGEEGSITTPQGTEPAALGTLPGFLKALERFLSCL
jgi:hypothetical protein